MINIKDYVTQAEFARLAWTTRQNIKVAINSWRLDHVLTKCWQPLIFYKYAQCYKDIKWVINPYTYTAWKHQKEGKVYQLWSKKWK